MAYNNPLFGEMPTHKLYSSPLQQPPRHISHPGERISLTPLSSTENQRNAQRIPAPWFVPYHNPSLTNNIRADPLFMYATSTNPLNIQVAHRDWAYKQWQKSNGVIWKVNTVGYGHYLNHNVVGKIPGVQDPRDVRRDEMLRPRNETRNLADELQYRVWWSLVLGIIALFGYAVAGPMGIGLAGLLFCLLMKE
jgi:hypothetical protein